MRLTNKTMKIESQMKGETTMLFFFMKKSEMSLDELMVANELNSL